jgi:3-hydroxyacyl-CoA dehydrogenase
MSQINKIGVIGAGNMGSGIAQKIAQEGINVVLVDITDKFVERGLGIIKQLLGEGVKRKIFTPGQIEQILSRITGTTDFKAVADADLDAEIARVTRILKRSSPATSTRIRDTINAAPTNTLSKQLDLEMKHQAVLIPRNMQEGAAAFMQKRKPEFGGERD